MPNFLRTHKESWFVSVSAFTLVWSVLSASLSLASSPSPKPDSPTYFRTSALGDLRDLEKDLKDFQRNLAKGGILRLLGNTAEIAFNVGQLQSLTPPEAYAKSWNKELNNLDTLTDELSADIGESSVSKTKTTISKISRSIKALRSIVNKVK